MGVDPKRDTPRVREARPEWPRRKHEAEVPTGEEWSRPPEVWETPHGVESYPGSTVLEDWALTEEDEVGTVRVLARYAVMRVLLLSEAGLLTGQKLRTERRIATEHLSLLPLQDWERMALQRLNDLCREPPAPLAIEIAPPPPSPEMQRARLLNAINVAAEAAAKRGHVMGAFSLYRASYAMGLEREAWDDAARGARGIAQLARMDEARYSTRLWDRRANVLEKRAARALAAREAAAAAAAENETTATTE